MRVVINNYWLEGVEKMLNMVVNWGNKIFNIIMISI